MKFPSRQGSAKAGESRNPVGFWGVPGWLDFYGMKSQHEEKQEILGIEIQVHLVRVKSPKIWKKISYQPFSRWNVLYQKAYHFGSCNKVFSNFDPWDAVFRFVGWIQLAHQISKH